MEILVENHYRFVSELRSKPDLSGTLLASEDVTDNVAELIDEACTNGVLSEALPAELDGTRAMVRPVCKASPVVDQVDIDLFTSGNSRAITFSFHSGRWVRSSQRKVLQLREEGSVGQEQPVYQMLLALQRNGSVPITLPPFQPPLIASTTLEDCGVRTLADGEFTPDRPLLINARLAQEAIQRCIDAGLQEAGAAVVGRCVRLPQPLPGTSTSVVTILSALMFDPRHAGTALRFDFHPAALVEAQGFCDLRGLGESVVTVFHTHGWGCGECNQKADCALPEGVPSLQDYQLLETLFPGKNTLMPIAGRKFAAEDRQPVLQVHAWRTGQMRPIRWRKYQD